MATTTATPPKNNAPGFLNEKQEKQNTALGRVLQSALVIQAADKYKIAPDQLFGVLMRTVFPKNKEGKVVATVEQFVAFLAVAQQYDLNPFTREIYAFPSKGGGVIPIVPVDGWVKIVQRAKDDQGRMVLDGIKFIDHFEQDEHGKPTLIIYATTCLMTRKDMSLPIEVTEYLVECQRDTEPWNKWPRRMLRHKSLIQCGRVAFGLAGIYDPDEAERILESEQSGRSEGVGAPEIIMPKRVTPPTPTKVATQINVHDTASVIRDMDDTDEQKPSADVASEDPEKNKQPESEPRTEEPAGEQPQQQQEFEIGEGGEAHPVIDQTLESATELEKAALRPEPKRRLADIPKDQKISDGQKKKLFAVMNSAKAHDDDALHEYIWLEFGVEHVMDIPKAHFNETLTWASAGKLSIK